MCKCHGEVGDHLLLHSPIAKELCTMVLSLFGVHLFMPWRVLDLLTYWYGQYGSYRNILI